MVDALFPALFQGHICQWKKQCDVMKMTCLVPGNLTLLEGLLIPRTPLFGRWVVASGVALYP